MQPFLDRNLYKHCVVPLSPVDLGIPTGRSRKFLICLNVSKFSCLLTHELHPEPLLEKAFYRTLVRSVDVYSDICSAQDLRDWKVTMLEQKGWQHLFEKQEMLDQLNTFPARKCLPGSLAQRLSAYEDEYEKAAAAAGAPRLHGVWVDLNQTIAFYQSISDVAPPLLATSKTWNMARRRTVSRRELLVSMGFCVPLGEETERQEEKFLKAMASLTQSFWPWWNRAGEAVMPESFLNTQRLGNGMHTSVIGSVLALSLSLCALSAGTES